MPRPPKHARSAASMPGAVFSPLARRIAEHAGPLAPLHVGDTWMEPFVGGRMEDLKVADEPGMHRYCDTAGIPPLLDALLEKVRNRNGLACERESLLVTAGATGALTSTVGALADPGDEVLILAPFWPLFRGIVQAMRAEPVEVPFYDRVDSAADAVEAVEEKLGPRTVALYVSTPSNPTGRVVPRAWLEALAELARRRDLWLISDEVYEEYVYRGEHVSIAVFAPERTISVYSFSKTYGTAGNRVGYLVGPPELVTQAREISTHTVYHAPTAGQLAALRALEGGAEWVAKARQAYRRSGAEAAGMLGVPEPEGSMFLFLDVSESLDERGLLGFLEDCLAQGALVAPGYSCGTAYGSWVRLCYAAAPPAEVAEAVRSLARQLGSGAPPAR